MQQSPHSNTTGVNNNIDASAFEKETDPLFGT